MAGTAVPALPGAPAPSGGRRESPARPGSGRHAGRWPGAVFVAPHMLMLGLFMLAPTVYAVYTSLFTSKLIGGEHFSGFANYATVLRSGEFWGGVGRVLAFAVVQVPVTLALAFAFAVLFDSGLIPGARFFRTLYFLPFAVPGVVAALMWSFLLLPGFGPYAKLMDAIGLHGVNFFSKTLILPTIVLVVIWEWTGYNMTVLYTSLTSIPREVTEAALMDGASFWRIATRIKLPMVMSSIVMLTFLNGVGALQLFTEPSILATFQPQAVSFGFTPSLFVYHTAVGSGQYNLGAAAAVILAVIIGLVSVGGLALRRRNGEFR